MINNLYDNDLYLSIAALMNDTNNGCGCSTVLLYSGWNCVPMYHFNVGISTISTKSDSGFDTYTLHAGLFELFAIVVVEFVAVAMTLLNVFFFVRLRIP